MMSSIEDKLLKEQCANVQMIITADNNLITVHRIGWIIWIHQIIKRTGHHISKAKSFKI